MRRAHKVDRNQRAIVDALRATGCVVVVLSAVGMGVPDLLVGAHGRWVLLEVKYDFSSRLTDEQHMFHARAHMRGLPCYVATNEDEAFRAVGVKATRRRAA